MRGVFVTGTDTGVGKSVLAAAICAALVARGHPVAAFKPVVTGLDEEPAEGWPPDHELLASATGGRQTADEVTPYAFGPAVSPHYAAELTGEAIDPSRILVAARAAYEGAGALVCEGVGGLLVPITPTTPCATWRSTWGCRWSWPPVRASERSVTRYSPWRRLGRPA